MKFSENVDNRENSGVCVNIAPVNNVMLSVMPGVLERSAKKLQGIIKRLENPIPLGEPYERNETSNILREVERALDTAMRIAENEPSDNAMLPIVPGMLANSKKELQGIIWRLNIPIPLSEPDERNEASDILREVDLILDIVIQIVKDEASDNAIEGCQTLAIEML